MYFFWQFLSPPDRNPMWMLMAYMPGTGGAFTDISPGFEFSVSMTAHTTFFMPKIATLYTSLEPTETKVIVSESDPHPDDDCKLEDDDDPSLLDMTAFTVTEPPLLFVRPPKGVLCLRGRRPPPSCSRTPKPGGPAKRGRSPAAEGGNTYVTTSLNTSIPNLHIRSSFNDLKSCLLSFIQPWSVICQHDHCSCMILLPMGWIVP